MRTNIVLAAFIALSASAAMITGSGFAAVIGQDSGTIAGGAGDRLGSAAEQSPGDGIEASRASDDEGSIVGTVVASAEAVATLLGFALVLGDVLQALGAPPWFASTVNAVTTILVGIGLAQFVSGRVLR